MKLGLYIGKGRRSLLRSFIPEGKELDYYYKTSRGFEYVTTFNPSDIEDMICQNTENSDWDLDISLGILSKELTANMMSANLILHEDDELTLP